MLNKGLSHYPLDFSLIKYSKFLKKNKALQKFKFVLCFSLNIFHDDFLKQLIFYPIIFASEQIPVDP